MGSLRNNVRASAALLFWSICAAATSIRSPHVSRTLQLDQANAPLPNLTRYSEAPFLYIKRHSTVPDWSLVFTNIALLFRHMVMQTFEEEGW